MEIIDSHCHVYPSLSYLMRENSPKIPTPLMATIKSVEKIERALELPRETLSQLSEPAVKKLHKTLTRFNNKKSGKLHFLSDKLYSLGSMRTLLNCTLEDLHEQMNTHKISRSIIIASPPYITNDFVLESAKKNNRLIPIVNIPRPIPKLEEKIKSYKLRGAKGLKIHAAMSGLNPNSSHHKNILKIAEQLNLPVIIHTGALDIKPLYSEPEHGHAEYFETILETISSPIILAHMNIHFPEVAIHLVRKFDHVYTDTSWQDEKTIAKAIKKCGAQKVLFGTDWPIIGGNIEVGIKRILQLKEKSLITNTDCEKVFYTNAKNIFKIT